MVHGKMKHKFCWLPTNIYSSRYYRDGFAWLSWAWVGDDGKAYKGEVNCLMNDCKNKADAYISDVKNMTPEQREAATERRAEALKKLAGVIINE